ncbi:MAG: cysteine--tRNA ligase [Planctomycetota bacterium]|nr:MAG: cysteine--tRNA ligase [Planctomycetota bacterium]
MAGEWLRERLRLYDTLTKRSERFEPLEPGHVRMYHCGPTVYAYAHIGNMSAFVFADLVRRVMEHAGYRVTQVMNITDVGHLTHDELADAAGEDKLEAAARRSGRTPWDLARHYTAAFLQDLEALGVRAAHAYPRATEFVPEMIALIERLLARGYAYVTAAGNVYYDVRRFAGYGRLSGNTLERLEAGARVQVREDKRHPHDFALWKVDPAHIMQWEPAAELARLRAAARGWGGTPEAEGGRGPWNSPWGRGFPGWHIECSAMAMRFLGESFDIHTGGEDNIFPHHECEIAQSEGATGKPFVRRWLHTRFLLVDGKKMSKRLGNFYTLRDLVARGWTGREVRYALLSTHYRSQPNFTFELLAASRKALGRLEAFRDRMRELAAASPPGEPDARLEPEPELVARARERFESALADDLNVSAALAVLFELVREGNRAAPPPAAARAILQLLAEADAVLGLGLQTPAPAAPAEPAVAPGLEAEAMRALLAARERARAARDFARADAVRELLREVGYGIEDLPSGPRLRRLAAGPEGAGG